MCSACRAASAARRTFPRLRLIFNLEAIRKLAERGLSADDVADVFRATPVVTVPNPNPRADHSLLAIGPTRDGRFVTVVVEQDHDDHGRWYVLTAWQSTAAQIALYRKAR
jgi:uncharacterized DUF497 family protein